MVLYWCTVKINIIIKDKTFEYKYMLFSRNKLNFENENLKTVYVFVSKEA